MTDEMSLTVSRLIAAPPERVFAAWLDPKMLLKFMTLGEGASVAHAETAPRVGGRYAITMKVEVREIPHGGTYLEITPHTCCISTNRKPLPPRPPASKSTRSVFCMARGMHDL